MTMLPACEDTRAEVVVGPGDPEPIPLTIWNSTQHPLEEVRAHSGPEYRDAVNQLEAHLAHDSRAVVDIFRGQRVTVIRRNVEGGQRIANLHASWRIQLAEILQCLGLGSARELRGRTDLLIYLE